MVEWGRRPGAEWSGGAEVGETRVEAGRPGRGDGAHPCAFTGRRRHFGAASTGRRRHSLPMLRAMVAPILHSSLRAHSTFHAYFRAWKVVWTRSCPF